MTTKLKLAMFAVAVLPVVQAAVAQDTPSGPPKEMAQLKTYEGDWTCHGSTPESPLGPAHKSTSNVKLHPDLGGMWVSGRAQEAATKENPHSYQATVHMTYDAAAKNFLTVWVDNLGGWAMQTSPGWDGDKMVWLGDGSMAGKKIVSRDTFTKKGTGFQHLGEFQLDGKWVVVQDESCARQAAKK